MVKTVVTGRLRVWLLLAASDERFLGIILQRELADLGVQRLEIHWWGSLRRRLAKDAGRALEQLVLPVGDLVGVDVELLGELCQRLVAANGGQRDPSLERWGVVTSRPSGHFLLRLLGPAARSQEQIVPLIPLPRFLGPPLIPAVANGSHPLFYRVAQGILRGAVVSTVRNGGSI